MVAAFALSGGLLADDLTGIGAIDDVLIPAVIGAGAIASTAIIVDQYLIQPLLRSRSNPFSGRPGTTRTIPGKQTREYAPDGWPQKDIDYDHDHDGVRPHQHDWGRPSDGGPPTHRDRGPGRPLEP